MATEFDRLTQALAPEIALQRKLASGGMGTVWLGREVTLDRLVAIKTLNPEQFTAQAAERFVEEAQHASRLLHPNIIRVHYAGDRAGTQFFVMDYVDGDTLHSRLERGTLSLEDTVALGHDLLAALAVAHRHAIIHRDVKPANIFLTDGRALLGDFGIAKALDRKSDRETTQGPIGTPLYMPPEQWRGQATARSDLYAVGAVLWEACTGRRWEHLDPGAVRWSEVPASLRPALMRALQPDESARWPDAEAFAAALPARDAPESEPAEMPTRAGPIGWRRLAAAAVAAIATGLAWWFYPAPVATSPPSLVVFPFDQVGALPAGTGHHLAGRAGWYLDRLPRIARRSSEAAARAWRSSDLPVSERLAALTAGSLHADFGLWGQVQGAGTRLEAHLRAFDARLGTSQEFVVAGDAGDLPRLGDEIGLAVVRNLLPDAVGLYQRSRALFTTSTEAAAEFFLGEDAASRDAWKTAAAHYERALRADPAFVQAAWRLGNARRWLVSPETFPPGFFPLDAARERALSPVERMLVNAQFAPTSAQRFALYREAVDSAPHDAYAALLYGDELFHRGPLAGLALDTAVAILRRATTDDSSLAPAWEHLAWALIRQGHRPEAEGAVKELVRVSGGPEESLIYLPALLQAAFALRFEAPAGCAVAGMFPSPRDLALAARGALAFDLPECELAFGRALLATGSPRSPERPNGLVAEGVALMALGRPAAAIARFDSATALFVPSDEADLQAGEWRVVPAALGIPGIPEDEVRAGRARLGAIAASPAGPRAARAAWALGLDAFARGDTAAGGTWRAHLQERGAAAGPLGMLLAALAARGAGDPAAALALTVPVLAYDSAGTRTDPFLRAAVHLLRGEWLAAAGDSAGADRAWLWYENTDAIGWPSAEAQPADVDWALGGFAGARRAALALRRGEQTAGCALAARTRRFWSDPEPAVAASADSLRRLARDCPA